MQELEDSGEGCEKPASGQDTALQLGLIGQSPIKKQVLGVERALIG